MTGNGIIGTKEMYIIACFIACFGYWLSGRWQCFLRGEGTLAGLTLKVRPPLASFGGGPASGSSVHVSSSKSKPFSKHFLDIWDKCYL